VDILPFLDGTDAVASSQDWISKHEERGKLLQHESQNILELAFPAQFPALTEHRLAWLGNFLSILSGSLLFCLGFLLKI